MLESYQQKLKIHRMEGENKMFGGPEDKLIIPQYWCYIVYRIKKGYCNIERNIMSITLHMCTCNNPLWPLGGDPGNSNKRIPQLHLANTGLGKLTQNGKSSENN